MKVQGDLDLTGGDIKGLGAIESLGEYLALVPFSKQAAGNTKIVTLTKASATDYGTADTFTIDAADCHLGKNVVFGINGGVAAPAFINAPDAQSFVFIPANLYADGGNFRYSLLVCSDMIQVVMFAI